MDMEHRNLILLIFSDYNQTPVTLLRKRKFFGKYFISFVLFGSRETEWFKIFWNR